MAEYWPFSLSRQSLLKERLIVDLGHGPRREALAMVEYLSRYVGMFKVGKHLYLQSGPELIREIRKRGAEVFLDLKFHTPRFACKAGVEATRLGVKMFDLHAGHSVEMMERTRHEVNRLCHCEGLRRPYIVAIAMLAGVNGHVETCSAQCGSAPDQIALLARLAADASMDGVVTSPCQVSRVRTACGRRVMIVTSAFSPDEACCDHPDRVGPAEAVRSGADYLMLGKPVWNAADPLRMIREVLREMDRGVRSAQRGSLALFSERPSVN
ncbi:MAG TPA: orotidine 5'-phosphate decarboxylase / HUMPS family protein [Candidatus Binataceae bacterium]|nr:orotidine 5'-phosphate decarboxylase / HUMPS family protein [Candidatus Binataceae bacterium]